MIDQDSPEARLADSLVPPSASITEAVARLERAGTGVLLLVEEDMRLWGILTDGDIRRAILGNVPFEKPCRDIATRDPIVGRAGITASEALHLLDHGREFVLDQLPLVTEDRRVAGLILRSDLVSREKLGVSAVIMAGGYGKRLLPLTEQVPKPMLPVGDRPLLERTIAHLRDAGIHQVNVTTHYLSEQIRSHFGDGRAFGVDLTYVTEDLPLGTAGGLRLLPERDEPLLVINGDVLTSVDFRSMLAFHRKQGADLTVGVRKYDLEVPYGVVETEGHSVRAIKEKPHLSFLINAGVYLLEPNVRRHIPEGERSDMTDLVERLLEAGQRVASFPIVEYWLDVGGHADYRRAQSDVKKVKFS
jgi:dTDP-glucose pyrophosphorylase